MVKITYIEQDGKAHEVDVSEGMTVMEGAVNNMVPGIDAECGGACACATCHVYVDAAWWPIVGCPGEIEAEMLEFTASEVRDTSRLSCQIEIQEHLDGLIVQVPEQQ